MKITAGRKRAGIFIITGIIVICGIWYVYDGAQQPETSMYEVEPNKSREAYEKDLAMAEKEQKQLKKKITSLKQKLKTSEANKKHLDQLDDDIEHAKDDIMRIQKECIRIGKFVCKVNSCQGDPTDPNYQIYVDITYDLKDAKDALFKAQDTYDMAKASASAYERYQNELKDTQQQYRSLTAYKNKIEALLKK